MIDYLDYSDPPLHCVYPQANANIDALPLNWRQEGYRILERIAAYLQRHPDAVGERLHCGCCCGHSHKLLTDAEKSVLEANGFLVELES